MKQRHKFLEETFMHSHIVYVCLLNKKYVNSKQSGDSAWPGRQVVCGRVAGSLGVEYADRHRFHFSFN